MRVLKCDITGLMLSTQIQEFKPSHKFKITKRTKSSFVSNLKTLVMSAVWRLFLVLA